MQKVAHYIFRYLPLTETWIYPQVAILKKFDPIILCRRSENLGQFPAEAIFSFRDSHSYLNRVYQSVRYGENCYLRFYESVIQSQKPVLIHAHFGDKGYEILPLAKKCGIPLVTSFYGVDAGRLIMLDPVWNDRFSELFHSGAAFLAEGNHMSQTLQKLGCPNEKIHVIRLGINLDRFPYQERDGRAEIRILAAGAFREKKGHPYTIQAFNRLAPQYNNISLTLIGDAASHRPYEMEEKQKILAAIEHSQVSDRVKLLGFQPYGVFIRELYAHDIFISPSVHATDGDSEGGAPVAIIEASASGMPIVSTLHCDIPEVVMDSVSGFLVAEKDSDALAEKLEQLITDAGLRKRMGIAGRKHIEKNYDMKVQVPKLEKVYETISGGQ
jgi:colanic acid/amylovoran biosynthesis glycosyltransferase